MKKAYAQSTFKRKYREIGLSKETVRKLQFYLKACANFYHVAEADEVWQAILKTEKYQTEKDLKKVISPEMVYAAGCILMDEDETVSDAEDEIYHERVIDNLEIMSLPMNPMPTRAQFDAFLRVEEHRPEAYVIFEEKELFDDGIDGKYLIVNVRILLDVPEDFSEDMADEETFSRNLERMYALDKARTGKKLYIPKDLLCYAAMNYVPYTKQAQALQNWMIQKGVSSNDTDVILYNLYTLVRDVSVQNAESKAMDCLTRRNLVFNGIEDVQAFMNLFTDYNNHTCLPLNKGQTPVDMFSGKKMQAPQRVVFSSGLQEAIRKENIDPKELKKAILEDRSIPEPFKMSMVREVDHALSPGEERWIGGTLIKGEKIGSNDPCPCGSGKKYKKCFGKN